MRHASFLVVFLFALLVVALAVGAQEDSVSLSGTLGSEATVYPYFADISWLSLYLNFAGFTISSKTSLSYASPISISQVFGLAYTWNWLTLGSKLYMGLFPFPLAFDSASIYGEASLFDTLLGNAPNGASFSGGIGSSAMVYPSVTDDLWFNLSLQSGAFSLSSETTFSLMPFGFDQQRFDIGFGFDGLSLYAWGVLPHTLDPSGGVGFYFDFP